MSRFGKIVVVVALLGWGLLPAASTQAGLIPWLYNAIFGPVYPPGYYGNYAVGYYPAPAVGTAMAPPPTVVYYAGPPAACAPPAVPMPPIVALPVPLPGPCGCPVPAVATSVGCPTSSCGTTATSLAPSPEPDQSSVGTVPSQRVPKTFAEEPESKPAGTFDEGFRPREESQQTPSLVKPKAEKGKPTTAPVETKAFKVPIEQGESAVPEKKPAPEQMNEGWVPIEPKKQAEPTAEEQQSKQTPGAEPRPSQKQTAPEKAQPAQDGSSTKSAQPSSEQPKVKPGESENDSGSGEVLAPALKLDEKLSWHFAPARRRLSARTGWLAVPASESAFGWSVAGASAAVAGR